MTSLRYSLYTRLTWPQLHTNMDTHTHSVCLQGPEPAHCLSVRPWGVSLDPRTHAKTCRKDQWARVYRATYPPSLPHTSTHLHQTITPTHPQPPSLWPAPRQPTEWRYWFPHINAAFVKSPRRRKRREKRREWRRERWEETCEGAGGDKEEEGRSVKQRLVPLILYIMLKKIHVRYKGGLNFCTSQGLWNVKKRLLKL